jgi:hypothetical protein
LTGSKVADIAGRGATRSSTRNVLEKFHTDLVRTSSNTIAKVYSHQQLHKTLDIGYLRGDSKGGGGTGGTWEDINGRLAKRKRRRGQNTPRKNTLIYGYYYKYTTKEYPQTSHKERWFIRGRGGKY